MKISSIIVEDEPLARQNLREYISEIGWLEVIGEATNGKIAVEKINILQPDLLFLDVHIPEISGIEVVKRINTKPFIIFTTAYDQYAITAFQIGAIDYLLKPFGKEIFMKTMNRVKERLPFSAKELPISERIQTGFENSGYLQRIFARKTNKILPIKVTEVSHFEANDDYVAAHFNQESHLLLMTLTELEKKLDPHQFIRIHRSLIINLDFVTQMQQQEDSRILILLTNGARLMASRSGSQKLRSLIA